MWAYMYMLAHSEYVEVRIQLPGAGSHLCGGRDSLVTTDLLHTAG